MKDNAKATRAVPRRACHRGVHAKRCPTSSSMPEFESARATAGGALKYDPVLQVLCGCGGNPMHMWTWLHAWPPRPVKLTRASCLLFPSVRKPPGHVFCRATRAVKLQFQLQLQLFLFAG